MASKNGFKDAVKDRLTAEIERRQKEIDRGTNGLIKEGGEADRKFSSFGNASGSHAADTSFVPDYAAGHLDHLAGEVILLRGAIKKVDEGTYGICSECGEAISLKRLDVMPLTENCTDCAKEKEAAQKKLCRKGSDPTRRKYTLVALRG